MKRKLFRATLLFLLASSITAGPGFLSPTAHALPGRASITTYYNNPAHSHVVGEIEVVCHQIIRTGQVTAYFTVQDLGPC